MNDNNITDCTETTDPAVDTTHKAADTIPQEDGAEETVYPSVSCYGLTKQYSGCRALYNVSLELPRGKIIGLLGPNGSGKTTLVKIIAGLLHEDSGEIYIDGCRPGTSTKAAVSYLPERSYLDPGMRVSECVRMFGDFYTDFDSERAVCMLSALGVPYNARLKALSKGTREKVGLVLVMSRRAKLYLLDEPIGGVDPASRDYILHTIIANRPAESSILLSTHLIRDVEGILDGFVFLGGGQVVMSGDANEVRAEHGMSLDGLFREVFRCY